MDKTFKTLEEAIDYVQQEPTPPKWELHRIFVPRQINGRWYLPGATVYRKFVLSPGGGFYQYGDAFDFLKDS